MSSHTATSAEVTGCGRGVKLCVAPVAALTSWRGFVPHYRTRPTWRSFSRRSDMPCGPQKRVTSYGIWHLEAYPLTGRGAGLPSSRCLVCQSTRDDIAHLLVCPYTLALQTWLAAVLRALKLRPTEMSILHVLPLGYGGEQTGQVQRRQKPYVAQLRWRCVRPARICS